MDKENVKTFGGSKVHAVSKQLRPGGYHQTICKMMVCQQDTFTTAPVTCKRCLERMEKEGETK